MGSEWVLRCGEANRMRNGKTRSDPISQHPPLPAGKRRRRGSGRPVAASPQKIPIRQSIREGG